MSIKYCSYLTDKDSVKHIFIQSAFSALSIEFKIHWELWCKKALDCEAGTFSKLFRVEIDCTVAGGCCFLLGKTRQMVR